MHVVNVHHRLLHASPARVSELLASLGSPDDRLWPRNGWPRMRLDGPVAAGAAGGHGPIRYVVEAWEPGRLVRFRFAGMRGVDGWHAFEILEATPHHCVLEHRMEARLSGMASLKWATLIRPLHDACVEDALSQAQASLGETPRAVPWSPVVRLLMRWLLRGRRGRTRRKPHAPA
jgi:hypothetical protein